MEQDKNDRLGELFNQARNEKPKVSFEETQQQFLKTVGSSTSFFEGPAVTKLFTVKSLIMSIVAISVLAISGVFLFSEDAETLQIVNQEVTETDELIEKSGHYEHLDNELLVLSENEKITTLIERKEIEKQTDDEEVKSTKQVAKTINTTEKDNGIPFHKLEKDTAYRFPILTEEEVKATKKYKKKLVSMNSKLEAFGFLKISKGAVSLDDDLIKIEEFQIKQTEVSNIQYRTFLFDLLINNKQDDFLKAKPDQSQWVKAGLKDGALMQEKYFSDEKYNDYPVVNISRKAAEMYCEWLAEEINKSQTKRLNGNKAYVSLPSVEQWECAASGGKSNSYSWDMDARQNDLGCFLANYKYESKVDTVTITGCDVKFPNALTTSGILLGNNNYTAKVNSYNPNTFGLYCMSGNVAEMIVYPDGTIGTKGGSWNSLGEDIKILGEDKYKGIKEANINIGFRPVMSFSRGSQYKTTFIPPGTVEIADLTYIDETEVSNFMWLEYLSWQEKTYGKESEEFKKALPDTTVWSKLNFNPYEKYYLRHSAYRDYPVVGISYEQAVAYCIWRTERVKELYAIKREEDKKTFYHLDFEYRLPTKEEWEQAANVGNSKKTIKKLEGKYEGDLSVNLKKGEGNQMGVAGKLNDNADVTAPVQSYYPNALGCYNLIGNVAEMTSEKGIAKGGSWKQEEKEVTVEKDFEYTKPNNWIGFRCVYKVLK